jgi:3'(2'), 5'-bisphosphate nucleotidase
MLPQRLFDAADIVRESSLLVREIQQALVTPALEKGDRSPVTVADFASQALIAARLKALWPGEPLVGEESGSELREPRYAAELAHVARLVARRLPGIDERGVCELLDHGAAEPRDAYWTLDPIDGTKGFLRKEQYAVALAFIQGGVVELAVLGCPELIDSQRPAPGGEGSLVIAARGRGAWLRPLADMADLGDGSDWHRLAVSREDDPSKARVLRSVESGHTDKGKAVDLSRAFGTQVPPIGMDSQAKCAVLAAGGAETLVRLISPDRPDYKEKIWDQAAGSLIIEEAGGRVTDLDGHSLDFTLGRTLAANRGVLATNGRLHEAALMAIRDVGA